MNAWSHLPNAVHIDRIVASEKANPHAWFQAWDSGIPNKWYVARDLAWRAASKSLIFSEASAEAWAARRVTVYDTTTGPILALIAYDGAAKYLEMNSYELKIWAALSEEPAAILLLPAVIVFERINKGEYYEDL